MKHTCLIAVLLTLAMVFSLPIAAESQPLTETPEVVEEANEPADDQTTVAILLLSTVVAAMLISTLIFRERDHTKYL